MSTFENYDVTSSTYTGMRNAVGWNAQLDHFRLNSLPLRQQQLLDAGCGTGNYTVHYARHFGTIKACDFSQGMLNQAKGNLENAKKASGDDNGFISEVTFFQQDVTNMTSVPSGSVDAICNNQVLHHFPEGGDFDSLRRRGVINYVYAEQQAIHSLVLHHFPEGGDFDALRRAASEFHRVLRSGGRGVINYVYAEQQAIAMWWAELIPEAMARWSPRTPNKDKMAEILQDAGFQNVTFEHQREEILYNPELYFEPRNFLDIDTFRRSDSTFALSTDDEIKKAVKKMEDMIASGNLDTWFQKKEAERNEIGQSVNVYFVKP